MSAATPGSAADDQGTDQGTDQSAGQGEAVPADPARAHALAHGHDHEDDVVAGECVDYIERIVYFLDNELDAADCSEVQRHLDECGPCLERYDLQRTVKTVVARSCAEHAPEALRERVLHQLRDVQTRLSDS